PSRRARAPRAPGSGSRSARARLPALAERLPIRRALDGERLQVDAARHPDGDVEILRVGTPAVDLAEHRAVEEDLRLERRRLLARSGGRQLIRAGQRLEAKLVRLLLLDLHGEAVAALEPVLAQALERPRAGEALDRRQ